MTSQDHRRWWVSAGLSLALALGPLAGANLYVDAGYTGGSNDGSVAHPYTTIGDAVANALSGDRILVAAGLYQEIVEVNGMEIRLESLEGPLRTTIDAGEAGPVVSLIFAGVSVVRGFTLTGGLAPFGGGVEVLEGSPQITRNIIRGNRAVVDMLGTGGFGGGIDMYDVTSVLVRDNVVVDNHADLAGGGINLENGSPANITFNTVVGNTSGVDGLAGYGPGIHITGTGTPRVINNIIAYNDGGLVAGGLELFGTAVTVTGNILFGNSPMNFRSGSGATPTALPETNSITDPLFIDASTGDLRLQLDSPAVDGADVAAPASTLDLLGTARPQDGDVDGTAVADVGCCEQPGEPTRLLFQSDTDLSWTGTSSPVSYHVYRGLADALPGDYGVCQDGRDANLMDTQFLETDIPAVGSIFTFLASFETATGESALGVDSLGALRHPAVTCP